MTVSKYRGFTIIEVMLFLAVSGVLIVSIMAGAGAAIAAQRYKDSVATLQSDMQQQYEDAISVKNGRVTSAIATCAGSRGQSDCVLMGKLMTIVSAGTIVQYDIWGRQPAAVPTDEYALLRAYSPTIVPGSAQTTEMEWGTGIAWPVSGSGASTAPRNIGILVIRSPQSGLVYTFTRDTVATNNLSTTIYPSARGKRTICIDAAGWLINDKMAISIAANAASASAIEVRSNQMIPDTELVC